MVGSDLPPLQEEIDVIRAAQSGDREAAARLYGWFGHLLYRQVILPRLPVDELAEDVLRDSFRIVFERIDQYEPRDRSIYFWLRRIAVNLVVDAYRRQGRDRRIAENILARDAAGETMADAPAAPDKGLMDSDVRTLIEGSLSKINTRYARALRLRLLEERSRQECADLMEVGIGAFDVLFHRACKAFRGNYPP
jgi:RNA polymerase sigma factor (sigma-70 family)